MIFRFTSSWFSSTCNTELMTKEFIKEDAVQSAGQKTFILHIYSFNYFSMRKHDYLVYFPYGMALIPLLCLSDHSFDLIHAQVEINESRYCISSVEIKSFIAKTTVIIAVHASTLNLVICRFGETKCRHYNLAEQSIQVLQQLIVLDIN